MVSSSETSPRYPIGADDQARLELLIKAFDWHRREREEYSLAECLEHLHRDHADRSGLPEPVEAYGDKFVAQELAHACTVLNSLCGATTCRAPGCSEAAPAHFGWCPQHDLLEALKLDGAE